MKALSLKELKNTTGGFNDRPYGRPDYIQAGSSGGSGGGVPWYAKLLIAAQKGIYGHP